ncbi:hypothetical protein BCR41DRAFT_423610 [Lobosporangium transversale]|uniref:Nudix hydrolase domain-containing protein n=1 Tax=Lobosporangium transversale TaxID=64571 RepID=A0A1Y2GI43_9FUNG|nr:hypothetical protein BCR41DRAFT_423610 [Lobosporangium transversale]ORZ11407.1 hypothetical protein BCR41DRAFT_423610 [Lobosporangium transversale]|eukprot:XP_021879722.1 hypothetical protein BCR41DRAFT_423610 [Lobosporangium transversale]
MTKEDCIFQGTTSESFDSLKGLGKRGTVTDSRDVEFDLTLFPIRKIFTLIFIHDKAHHQLLLGRKLRGALLGQWNGFGGKVDQNLKESISESALRELKEEAFMIAPLFPIGFIQWVVSPASPSTFSDSLYEAHHNQHRRMLTYRDVMVIYKAHSFELLSSNLSPSSMTTISSSTTPPNNGGNSNTCNNTERITEFEASDEMAPAWWDIDALPWESMRINHRVWYPFMLADRPFRGVYWYQVKLSALEGGIQEEKKATSAHRETAQEIWIEDLTKRSVQFGTAPVSRGTAHAYGFTDEDQGKEAKSHKEKVLEDYAKAVDVFGVCYNSTSTKLMSKEQELIPSEAFKEPTANPMIDENWLRVAITKAEYEWNSQT